MKLFKLLVKEKGNETTKTRRVNGKEILKGVASEVLASNFFALNDI